jgi:2-succinyl-5-enolpyruvyl-6-hydroxy-3-cyclohexene-1-carboxylate synthase
MVLLSAFVREGVHDVVVAPGSRSQALALAAAELERVGAIRLHVRIDERAAAFLALGTAVESGRPAVVVTTSGTAVANLHPAVLEAHHSGVPLIVCSADRPAELRGIRSNQTTMQPGIFAGAVRLERDVAAPEGEPGEADAATRLAREAVAAALGRDAAGEPVPHPGAGPVHLNLQYREPLSAVITLDDPPVSRADFETRPASPGAPQSTGALIEHGPRTVVVAGAGAGPSAEQFARDGGWPLFAEVTSGAHFGPNLVLAYRELLREPGFGDLVERVVVFGHPTLSREVPALVQRDGVETIAVAPSGIEWFNPGRRVQRFERAVRAVGAAPRERGADERAWVGRWVHASRALVAAGMPNAASVQSGIDETGHVSDFAAQREYMRAQLASVRAPVTRRMLVDAVWAATWPHDRLLLGASRLIRDADRAVPGRRITVHANRGLSGIDGTVGTALGIAIASQSDAPHPSRVEERRPQDDASRNPASEQHGFETPLRGSSTSVSGVTRALVGDLTLLHDVGSMLLGEGEPRPRLQLIVGNDGGGTIFDALEVAGTAPREAFDRVQFTPQHVDLAALAAAYGWGYTRAATRGELDEALTGRLDGPQLLEVPLER